MEQTKLSISITLKNSFALYKKNFGTMLKFALVSFLCGLPMMASNYLTGLEPGMPRSIGWLLMLAAFVLMFTVGVKNSLGAQFFLADMMTNSEGEKPTMKHAYAKTKGKVSILFGNIILLGMIGSACLVPFFVLFYFLPAYTELDRDLAATISGFVMTPPFMLLYPWSLLLTPVVAFEEKDSSKFSLVTRMIKGNYLRIVVVAFIGLGISALTGNFLRLFDIHLLIRSGISSVITLFTFGFNSAAAFVTYQQLKPKPQADTPPAEPSAEPIPENAPTA